MAFYRVCPFCNAALDPGEICDCKKEAALDAANIQSGKVEQVSHHSTTILTAADGCCQE